MSIQQSLGADDSKEVEKALLSEASVYVTNYVSHQSTLTRRYSVETCLKMCGLEAFGDAAIGSIGIERRRRATIAFELAAKVRASI